MTSPWKNKAYGDDAEELDPVFTYRHLLSSGLGVRNPLRVCGLTDMDAFYAACEQNRLKLDPEIPLVVRQWDALIAVNYPARKFGITRMESVKSALEKCPHLCVIHVATFDPSQPDAKPVYTDAPNSETHKVSLDYYRKESKKIMQIFKELLPEAEVERASIDEAFIDFTEPVRKYILSLMPHLASPPSTGLDTPLPPPPSRGLSLPYPPSRADPNHGSSLWEDLGMLVPLFGKPSESSQPKGTFTESQNLPPQTPQKQASFRSDRQFPDSTRQTAPIDYPWDTDSNYDDALLTDTDKVRHPPEDDEGLYDHQDSQPSFNTEVSNPPSWHDIALSIAASLLLRTRDEIKLRLGYTTSAVSIPIENKQLRYKKLSREQGLARNKSLAKLVASYKKRDNQTILRNLAIPNYLRPIAFQKIRFLGGKLGKAIAETYEAQTVGDLLGISLEEIQNKFGESSIWVWEILRGIDRSEVKEMPLIPKSMAASKNLHHPITHPSEGRHWLWILSGELAFRLQEKREENPGVWPRTLVLHARHSYTASRSKQAPFPFSRNPGIEYICKASEKLWADLVGTAAEYDTAKAKGKAPAMKITNIALAFTNVDIMASGQPSIEGFFLQSRDKRKASGDHARDQQKERVVKQPRLCSSDNVDVSTQETSSASCVGFYCRRCDKRIHWEIETHIDQAVALTSLKLEHNDFHFAEDIVVGDVNPRTECKATTKTKGDDRKPNLKGIERFFNTRTSSKVNKI